MIHFERKDISKTLRITWSEYQKCVESLNEFKPDMDIIISEREKSKVKLTTTKNWIDIRLWMKYNENWLSTCFAARIPKEDAYTLKVQMVEMRRHEIYIREFVEPAIKRCYEIIYELYGENFFLSANKAHFLKNVKIGSLVDRAVMCEEVKKLNLADPINLFQYILKYCYPDFEKYAEKIKI